MPGIQDISTPPGVGGSSIPQDAMRPAAPGPGGMQGGERAAVAYLETAVEMLDAAADEAPQLVGAVEKIKQFMAQVLGEAIGMGAPQESAPSYPPTGMPIG